MLFYEIKVVYQRQTGEDNPANVKESYLVEGLTPADVEKRLIEQIQPFIMGDLEVPSCTKKQFQEIVTSPEADKWYKGRVELITIEDSGKETRKTVSILVQATTAMHAMKNLTQAVSGYDCEIVSVARTAYMDVIRAIN